MSWKLGSLFDGSGGFPLAGVLSDIEPVWASEIEPYPIAVTRSRFPHMKHLGDISKVNGAEIEPVDIITFGSPCQDLSVAGKRAGLKHEANGDEETTRSGLFMEAVRIIKEMREATNGEYPRFALWENVPGAFSSNKGEDFRIVLEELIKIVEPRALMPEVPKRGWAYADSYVGNGWSIAYRVFDAQYWGVPQRRRRIHLVADFRGECAREVLFEREGVRGYFTKSGTPWESLAAYAERGTGADHREGADASALKVYGIDHAITTGGNCTAQGPCVYEDVQATLKASGPHSVAYALKTESDREGEEGAVSYGVTTKGNGDAFIAKERHTALSTGGGQAGQGFPCAIVPHTLKIRSGCEGGGKGALIQTNLSATLATNNDQYLFQPMAFAANQRDEVRDLGDKAGAIQAQPGMKQQTFVAEPVWVDGYNSTMTGEVSSTLGVNCGTSTGRNGVVYAVDQGGGKSAANVSEDLAPTLTCTHGGEPAVAYVDAAVVDANILDDQGGQQISVRADGKVPTLRAEMHGNIPCVMAYSFDSLASNSMKSSNPHSGCRQVEVAKTLDTTDPNPSKNQGGIAIVEQHLFENHSQDTRYKGPLDICPMLPAQLGTGGNNTPFVVERATSRPIVFDGSGVTCPTNASNPQPGDPCHTLSTDSRNYVVEPKPVYCLQGNGIDRADTAGCNGKGWCEDVSYTLNTIDRPAVAYLASGKDQVGTLMANAGTKLWLGNQEAFSGDYHIIEEHDATGVDCRNATEYGEITGALQSSSAHNINSNNVVRVRYIVRRLTPTECARLQGFADQWGEIEEKKDFTDEEYRFWLDVRNTHAEINGKAVKDYTKQQMLTWYNKLHTDSAEYKMWGNGIALPPALYCMQGIADVLNKHN